MNDLITQFILTVTAGLTVQVIYHNHTQILNFIADMANLVGAYCFGFIATLFVLPLSYIGFVIHFLEHSVEQGFMVATFILAMAFIFGAFSRYFFLQHQKDICAKQSFCS